MNWDVRNRVDEILSGGFGAVTLVAPHIQVGIYASGPHVKIITDFIEVNEVVVRSDELEELAEFLSAYVEIRSQRGLAGKVLSCLGKGPSDEAKEHEPRGDNQSAGESGGVARPGAGKAKGGAVKASNPGKGS